MERREAIDLNNLPMPIREYQMTPDDIMEMIWDDLGEYVERLEDGDVADIHINITPASVMIAKRKKNLAEDDEKLGMSLEDWES
ncbi:MAG: hypothetical protein IKT15_03090 [Firmicutes bacterium]|nr:hypothetical protein [Bacillota bacterium]